MCLNLKNLPPPEPLTQWEVWMMTVTAVVTLADVLVLAGIWLEHTLKL